jgi:peroxiredoxin Q/BCP
VSRLEVGDPAPHFSLPAADGSVVSLTDFKGQRLVVYFYPAAMTPGCTTQACDFRDNMSDLRAAGVSVVGVSPDPPAKLAKFVAQAELTFPLLSDPGHAVLEEYGAWGEKNLYGKTVVGVIRSTVVVDAQGNVELAKYNVKAKGHVAGLLKTLGI